MTREQAKTEIMQIYGSLSEEKKQALDVLMAQADGEYISKEKAIIQLSWDLSEVELPRIKESLDKLPSVAIPSAYKGMTNGEVHDMLYQMLIELKDGADRYGAEKWWNSPYEPQERSE